jgi:two-component system CheB/CheR fusion protein
VADALGAEISDWSVRVFATDLDEGAVAFARRGIYPPAVLENVPPDYRKRFFDAIDGASYRVHRNLRQMVIYGQQDLSRAVPFPRIDLVVCRNLLIYFQPEVQQEALDLFAYSLHDTGGYLLLGRAETARPSSGVFEVVDKKWKVYRCLGGPITFRGLAKQWRRPATPDEPPPPPKAATEEVVPGPRLDEGVVRTMSVGAVVVDRAYRMVAVNPAARRLLGLRERGGERDFLHSVRDIPYAEIRTAIDTALRDRKPMALPEVSLGLGDDAARRYVNLSFAPLGAGDGPGEHVAIVVLDASATVAARQRLEAAEAAQRKLVDELNATNTRLTETNRDLQDANDELQATNEELMLAQEELQATNEEFEATNEELQATNEELETNNEEFQATNEELDTTNDELQARTAELQELAALLTLQRERMAEIIARSPVPMLVIRGQPPVVEIVNPLFAAIAGRGARLGRGIDEAFAGLADVAKGVREALSGNAAWMSEPTSAPAGTGRSRARVYVFTALPIQDEGRAAGAAVYAEDVTERVPPAAKKPRRRL